MAQIDTLNQSYEDFKVGDHFETAARTVTEADIVLFSGLSGDYSPHHTNEVFAAASGFGGRIAHGALILSIGTGLEFHLISPGDRIVAFYGMDRVRFVRPVNIGDTLHIKGEITELQAKDEDRGVVTISESFLNQHDEVVTVMTKRIMVSKSDK